MSIVKFLTIIFLTLWIYKFISNLYYWLRINRISAKYKIHQEDKDNSNNFIAEYLSEVKELFNKANIPLDLQVPFNTVDYIQGIEKSGRIQPLNNITSNLPEVIAFYNNKFLEAKGYFKKGCLETFNPIFWIEFVIYFPQKVLNYVSTVNDICVKIINIIYWVGLILLLIKKLF